MEFALAICLALHALALMGWLGGLALQRLGLVDRTGAGLPGARLTLSAAVLALASGAVWPWLQTGVALDEPAASIDAPQVWSVLTGTSFGKTWLFREGI